MCENPAPAFCGTVISLDLPVILVHAGENFTARQANHRPLHLTHERGTHMADRNRDSGRTTGRTRPERQVKLRFERLEERFVLSGITASGAPIAALPTTAAPPTIAASAVAPQSTTNNAPYVSPDLTSLFDGTLSDKSQLLFDASGRVGATVLGDMSTLLPALENLGFQPITDPILPASFGTSGYLPVQAIGQAQTLADDGMSQLLARSAPRVDAVLSELAAGQNVDT
ncbi:MAG TPA: hypothetical protein PK867_23325, partial [Pirellulales bacterium]|nr:hypothetical protein [Pirellulales bacterium]